MPFLILREIIEVLTQFFAIMDTALVADISFVYLRCSALCLNLILLPVIAVFSATKYGSLVSSSMLMFTETLFDRVYIIVGVYIQITLHESGSSQEGSQLFANLATLLPAFVFCLRSKNAFISFAEMQMEQAKSNYLPFRNYFK